MKNVEKNRTTFWVAFWIVLLLIVATVLFLPSFFERPIGMAELSSSKFVDDEFVRGEMTRGELGKRIAIEKIKAGVSPPDAVGSLSEEQKREVRGVVCGDVPSENEGPPPGCLEPEEEEESCPEGYKLETRTRLREGLNSLACDDVRSVESNRFRDCYERVEVCVPDKEEEEEEENEYLPCLAQSGADLGDVDWEFASFIKQVRQMSQKEKIAWLQEMSQEEKISLQANRKKLADIWEKNKNNSLFRCLTDECGTAPPSYYEAAKRYCEER